MSDKSSIQCQVGNIYSSPLHLQEIIEGSLEQISNNDIINQDPELASQIAKLGNSAKKHKVPSASESREYELSMAELNGGRLSIAPSRHQTQPFFSLRQTQI